MSHPLKKSEVWRLRTTGKDWAGVCVSYDGKALVLDEHGPDNDDGSPGSPIIVLRSDVELAPLPDRLKVVDRNGKVIKPSKGRKFFITVITFSPHHVVTEMEE